MSEECLLYLLLWLHQNRQEHLSASHTNIKKKFQMYSFINMIFI